jgi:hypothetical protein
VISGNNSRNSIRDNEKMAGEEAKFRKLFVPLQAFFNSK